MQQIKISLLTCLAATTVWAAPTRRPLPPGIVDSHPEFQIFRDSETSNLFYVLPKRYLVVQNALTAYGDQNANCDAAISYDKTLNTLMEAKEEHGKATLQRLKRLNDLLTEVGKAEKGQAAALVAELKMFKEVVQTEQDNGLKQVEALEKNLEGFAERTAKPAGQVHIEVKMPVEDPASNTEFRKQFGFRTGDQIRIPKIMGIALYPNETSNLDFRERTNREDAVGVFVPDWSVSSFAPPAGAFGKDTINEGATNQDIEKLITFDQIVSLYTYCVLKRNLDVEHKLVGPLRITFTLATWKSESVSASQKLLVEHQKRLEPAVWNYLASLPAAQAGEAAPGIDRGEPSRYSRKGIYEAFTLPLSFKMSLVTQEDK